MKKLLIFACMTMIFASASFAIGSGIGARSMAMGGTGIAIANDVATAAYFNPAALMYGPENFETQLLGGGAVQGLTGIIEAFSSGDNFITDNFDKDYNIHSSISGGLGVSVRKVGISAIATGNANFTKPANALEFTLDGSMTGAVPLTLGSTFSTPGLPIASLSVGVNLKAIASASLVTNVTQTGLSGKGTMSSSIGSGFGFDIGAMGKLTPLISLGGVIRNLSASENILTKSKTIYVSGTGDVTDEAETETRSTYSPAPEVGIGAGIVIPITGTLIACDFENYSSPDKGNLRESISYTDTHIGIEQGVLFNLVMLRCGYFTYGAMEDSYYTYGLGLNAGPLNMGLAAANSVTDSRNSSNMAQIGMSF
jgi:hypothetical protein